MIHYADPNTRRYPYPVCGHSGYTKKSENPDDEKIDCLNCKKWIRKNIYGVEEK